jgi:hypothetical protein
MPAEWACEIVRFPGESNQGGHCLRWPWRVHEVGPDASFESSAASDDATGMGQRYKSWDRVARRMFRQPIGCGLQVIEFLAHLHSLEGYDDPESLLS